MSIVGLTRTVAPATSSCPGHAGDSDVAQQTGLSAKAYCGPAHGHTWTLHDRSSWPARVVLTCGEGQYEYHLVRDPRARRAARDHVGNIVYMPLQ